MSKVSKEIKPKVNPNECVIVRKRKKYRFALFYNADNCFELVDWQPRKSQHLVVEIGAGTGLFLVEQAKRQPAKQFVAIDVKADRLQKGARAALQLGLTNIWFVRARADQLLEIVKPGSVHEIWLTFSDPFPKKRDAKRRLMHPRFLELYKNAHVDKGVLYQKTDSRELFEWSLEQLVTSGWRLTALAHDLADSDLPDTAKILTTYEQKWQREGRQTYFVAAQFLE